jgi:hypothetical protein
MEKRLAGRVCELRTNAFFDEIKYLPYTIIVEEGEIKLASRTQYDPFQFKPSSS